MDHQPDLIHTERCMALLIPDACAHPRYLTENCTWKDQRVLLALEKLVNPAFFGVK